MAGVTPNLARNIGSTGPDHGAGRGTVFALARQKAEQRPARCRCESWSYAANLGVTPKVTTSLPVLRRRSKASRITPKPKSA